MERMLVSDLVTKKSGDRESAIPENKRRSKKFLWWFATQLIAPVPLFLQIVPKLMSQGLREGG
jgi:hypothetical protein